MTPRVRALSPVLSETLAVSLEGQQLQADRDAFLRLCRNVAELSELFTRRRCDLPLDYGKDGRLRRAYLAYFLPINVLKVQALLDEIWPFPDPDHSRPLRVLDVGSGAGTAALAVVDWARQFRSCSSVEIDAIDRAAPLNDALFLWQRYSTVAGTSQGRLRCIDADLEKLSWVQKSQADAYEVIIAANVLNELYRRAKNRIDRLVEFVLRLLSRLAPDGSLIIIEPALRATSRDLHAVRDQLLEHQAAHVYSPCLHQRSCPALLREEDWCHEERPCSIPDWLAAIDQHVGFIKDALKFSYLILRKDRQDAVSPGAHTYRVVSELRVLKGDTRAWLCNESGRHEVGRLDRARSNLNAPVDAWHRGSIVQLENVQWREGQDGRRLGRITPLTKVELIKPIC